MLFQASISYYFFKLNLFSAYILKIYSIITISIVIGLNEILKGFLLV